MLIIILGLLILIAAGLKYFIGSWLISISIVFIPILIFTIWALTERSH